MKSMMPALRRGLSLAAVALLVVAAVGCGGSTTQDVTGRVTYPDGETLPQGGRVGFDSQELGESFSGYTDAEGRFQVTLPPGEYRVSFKAPLMASELDERGEVVEGSTAPKMLASRDYANYDTSGLSYTVTDDGENTYDIVVERPE